MRTEPAMPPSPALPGFLLGFAMGGFLDGILLHQVLQWHHLLSAVEGPRFADLRVQIAADGWFHVAHYLIAIAGLWLLLRRRAALQAPGGSARVWAAFVLGFGVWHIVDGLLFHWLLAIHHILMDSAQPLLWDAGFFAIGVALALLGWWMQRRVAHGQAGRRSGGGSAGTATLVLVLALVPATGAVAALPPPDAQGVTVVFRADVSDAQVLAAAGAVGARIIGSDRSGVAWTFAIENRLRAWSFYRHGALFVGGTAFPGGCAPAPATRGMRPRTL